MGCWYVRVGLLCVMIVNTVFCFVPWDIELTFAIFVSTKMGCRLSVVCWYPAFNSGVFSARACVSLRAFCALCFEFACVMRLTLFAFVFRFHAKRLQVCTSAASSTDWVVDAQLCKLREQKTTAAFVFCVRCFTLDFFLLVLYKYSFFSCLCFV